MHTENAPAHAFATDRVGGRLQILATMNQDWGNLVDVNAITHFTHSPISPMQPNRPTLCSHAPRWSSVSWAVYTTQRCGLTLTLRPCWCWWQVYGSSESQFMDAPMPGCMIDPDGTFSQVWDVTSLVLLFYVILLVPYRICFGVQIDLWSGAWIFDLFVDLFFIADLFYNFRVPPWALLC